jgi:hypothetical protein
MQFLTISRAFLPRMWHLGDGIARPFGLEEAVNFGLSRQDLSGGFRISRKREKQLEKEE